MRSLLLLFTLSAAMQGGGYYIVVKDFHRSSSMRDFDSEQARILGPFATLAMCRRVGHAFDPSDPRFWTDAQKVAAAAAATKAKAELEARVLKLIDEAVSTQKPDKDGNVNVVTDKGDCTASGFYYNVKTKNRSFEWVSSGCLVPVTNPPSVAVTGCVRDLESGR